MHDRPSARELAEAVREFLIDEVLPLMDDHRMRFRTLVALNALGIAERELWALGADDQAAAGIADARDLAARIRAGDIRDGDLALLKEQVARKLRVTNPPYLAKYE